MEEENIKRLLCFEIEQGYRELFDEYCHSVHSNKSKYLREIVINLLLEKGLISKLGFDNDE